MMSRIFDSPFQDLWQPCLEWITTLPLTALLTTLSLLAPKGHRGLMPRFHSCSLAQKREATGPSLRRRGCAECMVVEKEDVPRKFQRHRGPLPHFLLFRPHILGLQNPLPRTLWRNQEFLSQGAWQASRDASGLNTASDQATGISSIRGLFRGGTLRIGEKLFMSRYLSKPGQFANRFPMCNTSAQAAKSALSMICHPSMPMVSLVFRDL